MLSQWIHFVVLFSNFLQIANGANWAQASGHIQQNIVLPAYPTPDSPHWTPRYGMAAVVSVASNLSTFSYAYIMGGDSYDGTGSKKDQTPGLVDQRWENGYKNDVWRMAGTDWFVKGNIRLKHKFKRKIPQVLSKLKWVQLTPGLHPPVGVTNDEWIQCEPYFRNKKPSGADCTDAVAVQWSPRRHHVGVFFKGYLWILGGRAREFVPLPEEKSIGGIMGPRVADILGDGVNNQAFSNKREASVIKSDVWRSADGRNWDLITPGCKAPQSSLIAKGNDRDHKFGTLGMNCSTDSDCYGAEECDKKRWTCVCPMWTSREQHTVAVYGGYMYLSGGYASVLYSDFSNCGPYACGDTDASGYRYYMSDVWRSADGEKWELITESAFRVGNTTYGRGGHQMLALKYQGAPYLWVFGGRGIAADGVTEVYYNDIWSSPITGAPNTWTQFKVPDSTGYPTAVMPWSGRTGHTVVVDDATPDNLYTRTIYLYGGYSDEGGFLDDSWTWRFEDTEDYWRQDFTPDAYFSTGSGDNYAFHNNSPSIYYVSLNSDLSYLRRFWIPTHPDKNRGQRYELRQYISDADIATINSVGINTIQDLADIDLYTVLKLRGFDIPQVPLTERLHVHGICDYRALARAVVKRCTVTLPNLYDGEQQMPWNIHNEFGGAPPKSQPIKWHGNKNYDYLLPGSDDVTLLTEIWDGCTNNPKIQGLHGPNVNGIGYVTQVAGVRDPAPEVQNLFCRQTPQQRAYHGMLYFEGRIYVFGGKQSNTSFWADAWYRDAHLPQVNILTPPKDHSPDPYFQLSVDKPGAYYEYRVWDPYNFKEVRGWTAMTRKVSVSWMNWRKGGPGTGRYQIYFRAVDAAGNRDERFVYGRNVHNWYYVSPTPWDIIFATIGAFVGLLICAYFEYRRRVKKAAMERYAMKRMRRKFKAMQRDIDGKAVDWRTLYMESKQAEEAGMKDKKKKIKKTKDKNAEKREKEKKKREKEKEMIKKKLKAAKEHKSKSTAKVAPPPEAIEDAAVDAKSTVKKLPDGSKRAGGKIAAIEEDSVMELEGEDEAVGDYPRSKQGGKKELEKSYTGSMFDRKKGKVAPMKEIAAGELDATKNTESGFKQRKVNKKYKEYEDPEAGGAEDAEHKKDA